MFVFETHVKGRWVGQNIVDMFEKEFPHHTRQYYERCVEMGRIRVDGKKLEDCSLVLQPNQKIAHEMHRHETPVRHTKLTILSEDDRFFAVEKPSSIPVHPCGRFAKNTIVSLLRHDHGLPAMLYPVHRLDRATSGVLLFAKTPQHAERAGKILRRESSPGEDSSVQKVYLARVCGDFPEEVECSYPIFCADAKRGLMKCILPEEREQHKEMLQVAETRRVLQAELLEYQQSKTMPTEMEKEEHRGTKRKAETQGSKEDDTKETPAEQRNSGRSLDAKLRKKEAFRQLSNAKVGDAKMLPKEAHTKFTKIRRFANGDSLVECRPYTGRTHQLRVHLLALGHPIIDDALYNPAPHRVGVKASGSVEVAVPDFAPDEICKECTELGGEHAIVSGVLAERDQPSSCMSICLHAREYHFEDAGKTYHFKTELPEWAEEKEEKEEEEQKKGEEEGKQ